MHVRGLGLMFAAAALVASGCSDNPARPTMSFAAPVAQQPVNGTYRAGTDHRKDGQASAW